MTLAVSDRIVLALVRRWCRIRHFRVIGRTIRLSGERPDPATPATDVDKFLWRKLFDHNPLFVTACDKLAAKDHALARCPEMKTAKVLWSGTDPDAIPQDILAGDVVVKANHGCRWNILVRNGKVDRKELRRKARHWLRHRYGFSSGEWAYKGARRKVIVEEMLFEDGEPVATEYKFHISAGRTAYVYISKRVGDGVELKCYVERDGSLVPEGSGGNRTWSPLSPSPRHAPMVELAERLARPFDFIRVDLYEIDGEIFFSELTVYPMSGKGGSNAALRSVRNAGWDIRRSWFMTSPQRGWRAVYARSLRKWCDLSRGSPGST
jgi:hypothetical protein